MPYCPTLRLIIEFVGMSVSSSVGFRFVWSLLGYVLRGRLRYPGGHRPAAGHIVPELFAGVAVAGSDDPAIDDYILARLREAGVRSVRIDFTYGDSGRPAARLLERLCADSFKVMLHLVQPYDEAQAMESESARVAWRDFVSETLNRFGSHIAAVEVGSTVNRKRWAGYTLDGFLAAWEIAHHEVRSRGIKLAGPSVTDFEPLYNIGLLSLLRRRKLLPDLHTDNLFSERCTEPERYDHKVFGHFLAGFAKVNLVKKARMLKKIGIDFGVPKLLSPAAFWTLPRIERFLPESEEKQADYLSRYMVLCAASGALEGAWWGPLICHREGLIDDGDMRYPKLERITHYAAVNGSLADFRLRPAFYALQAFVKMIPGSRYEGSLVSSPALEVHAFRSKDYLTHVVWTINGRAAALSDLYSSEDIQSAECVSRDGQLLLAPSNLVTETPLYMRWRADRDVVVNPQASIIANVIIHRHRAGKTHFLFRENGWQGLVLATDAVEASLLLQSIHPDRIGAPPEKAILRHARNAIWKMDDPRSDGAFLVVKQPVKMHLHKRLLDRLKPSKGLRSWNGTCELLRRGIDAALPVAYFEKIGDVSLTQNYYLCEYVPADFSAREMLASYASGEATFRGVDERIAYRQLADYLQALHGRGIFFRDLSGGNILIRKKIEKLSFSLIDTGRIHSFNRPLVIGKRLADLVRICNKLHWQGREQLMSKYLEPLGKTFSSLYRLPFVVYDAKVTLKRHLGRKGLKRLLSRYRSAGLK